ncbi:MAG: LppX_LprAFG lipoprotein [Nocardioides sp.]
MNRRPHTRARRALAAGVVVPLLVVGAAACGSDDDSSGDKATSTDSSASSEPAEETPAQLPAGDPVDADEFAQRLATGLEGMTTAKMQLTVEGERGGLEATGDLDYTGKAPAVALKATGGPFPGETEMILVDRVAYVQLATGAGKYLEVDLADPDSPLADVLGGLEEMDPRAAIESFADNVEQVVQVGDEEIDGTPTTHYALTADTAGILSQLGGGEEADLPKNVVWNLWLDEQDRPRQLEADLGEKASLHLAVTDIGAPVAIEAPPADQVQKMPGS